MAKVRKVMSTDVPRVKSSDTILQAATVMNREKSSGATVVEGEKFVGLITERALLWKFVPLNKRPDEVTVGEMLVPFFRIGPDESTKTAAKIMVENRITRLGVFEEERFLGWVTLSDLAREFSKPRLLKALMARDEPEEKQVLCPNCRKAFLEKITNAEGVILRWECPNCHYSL
ncbi:MAG TPA: CBS domain-containing protein [Candidatus Angelobacter sp.]|nr:CBS domain-containing protein [Candidatus Angelobacter sp.]